MGEAAGTRAVDREGAHGISFATLCARRPALRQQTAPPCALASVDACTRRGLPRGGSASGRTPTCRRTTASSGGCPRVPRALESPIPLVTSETGIATSADISAEFDCSRRRVNLQRCVDAELCAPPGPFAGGTGWPLL